MAKRSATQTSAPGDFARSGQEPVSLAAHPGDKATVDGLLHVSSEELVELDVVYIRARLLVALQERLDVDFQYEGATVYFRDPSHSEVLIPWEIKSEQPRLLHIYPRRPIVIPKAADSTSEEADGHEASAIDTLEKLRPQRVHLKHGLDDEKSPTSTLGRILEAVIGTENNIECECDVQICEPSDGCTYFTKYTFLAAPLIYEKQVIGVLMVQSEREGYYPPHFQAALDSICKQLVNTIEEVAALVESKPSDRLAKVMGFVRRLFLGVRKEGTSIAFERAQLAERVKFLCAALQSNSDDAEWLIETLPQECRALASAFQSVSELVHKLAPDEFFAWFDKHANTKSRASLQQIVIQFAQGQQGRNFGTSEANSEFARGLHSRMKQVGLFVACPGSSGLACGATSYFRCKPRHPSYQNGAFYFEHADQNQATHGWSDTVPEFQFLGPDGQPLTST